MAFAVAQAPEAAAATDADVPVVVLEAFRETLEPLPTFGRDATADGTRPRRCVGLETMGNVFQRAVWHDDSSDHTWEFVGSESGSLPKNPSV